MKTYRLELSCDETDSGETIEFEAKDPAGALFALGAFQPGVRAQLWEGEHFICTLSRDEAGEGVWQVA